MPENIKDRGREREKKLEYIYIVACFPGNATNNLWVLDLIAHFTGF
jgi:hypothetical protein